MANQPLRRLSSLLHLVSRRQPRGIHLIGGAKECSLRQINSPPLLSPGQIKSQEALPPVQNSRTFFVSPPHCKILSLNFSTGSSSVPYFLSVQCHQRQFSFWRNSADPSPSITDGTPAISDSASKNDGPDSIPTSSHPPSPSTEWSPGNVLDTGLVTTTEKSFPPIPSFVSECDPTPLHSAASDSSIQTLTLLADDTHHSSWFWNVFAAPLAFTINGLSAVQMWTGAPWWLTIIGCTLAMRGCLLPLTLMQLSKSAELARLAPHLPLPFPAKGSSMTIGSAWSEYGKRRREVGAPGFVWFVAPTLVHIGVMVTAIWSVRTMAVTNYPGFSTGGALWFLDLSIPAPGTVGFTLPLLIAVTYLVNIQMAFRNLPKRKRNKLDGLVISIYKWFLEFLTLPTFIGAAVLPQGVHLYWLTNNLVSIAQVTPAHLHTHPPIHSSIHSYAFLPPSQTAALQNPKIRTSLGLPPITRPSTGGGDGMGGDGGQVVGKGGGGARGEGGSGGSEGISSEESLGVLSAQDLIRKAAEQMVKGRRDAAIQLLRRALTKEPTNGPAHVALGQLHNESGQWEEGAAHFHVAAQESQGVQVQLAGLFGMGIARANQTWVERGQQGKTSEAIACLEGAINLEGWSDPDSRVRVGRSLITLASLLTRKGRKEEALTYLRRAVEFDPQVLPLYVRPLEKELGMLRDD